MKAKMTPSESTRLKVGLNASETSRDVSFCAHATLDAHKTVVNDVREDEHFALNPLKKIEQMNELVSMCSYCKSVRNSEGFWSSIEQFIEQHSEAELTHGICDDCLQKHYPEAAKLWQAKLGCKKRAL